MATETGPLAVAEAPAATLLPPTAFALKSHTVVACRLAAVAISRAGVAAGTTTDPESRAVQVGRLAVGAIGRAPIATRHAVEADGKREVVTSPCGRTN